MKKPELVVALDVDTLAKAEKLVDMLYPETRIFKVGSQLFTHAGPEAINMIRKKGAKVFLDLKFHDIPNTVASAVKASKSLGVFILNVHASGGAEMMRAAVRARGKSKKPILLAVTMLTSMDKTELNNIGISRAPIQQVKKLALLAKQSGIDGVVCSGHEIEIIRSVCGKDFIILTPGIRPAVNRQVDDQKRIMTPQSAAQKGCDYIVMGRPIIEAVSPLTAVQGVLQDINCVSRKR
jgi:orotidine-5'-phosphate decarboxylase